MGKLNYKYELHKYGIGFQIVAIGFRGNGPIMQHYYALLTMGYRNGRFVFRMRRNRKWK